jgi:hypothetical protein
VFHRPLVLIGALAGGDFLLWNWSLSANHDVLALIAGVTLLPLAAASLLLAALTALQLASRFSRHPLLFAVLRHAVPPRPRVRRANHGVSARSGRRPRADARVARGGAGGVGTAGAEAAAAHDSPAQPPRKIAA